MKILGINKKHFFIYLTSLLISIVLLAFVFVKSDYSIVFISIGSSGIASAILGYFIELANQDRISEVRERNLSRLVYAYKRTLERFMFYIFKIIIDIYREETQKQLYKVTVKQLKDYLDEVLTKYDLSAVNNKSNKYKRSFEIAQRINDYIKNLSMHIRNITNQDLFGLLKYYREDEIIILKDTAVYFDSTEITTLEDYFYLFKSLTSHEFYSILGLKDIDSLTYYYRNKEYKSALYLGDKLWINTYRFNDMDITKAKNFIEEQE